MNLFGIGFSLTMMLWQCIHAIAWVLLFTTEWVYYSLTTHLLKNIWAVSSLGLL